MPSKNTDNNTEKEKVKRKRLSNLILWEPGQSGNPKGRPAGTRNYKTVYREAIKKIAKSQEMSEEDIEDILVGVGITKAIKGDYFFHRDIMDRIHGKPKETLDLANGGVSIAELIGLLHGRHKKTTTPKPRAKRRVASGANKKRS